MNSASEKQQEEAVAVAAPSVPSTDNDEPLQEDLQEASDVFNSLFSTRRPKDGWAGLSSGLKSASKGTVAGLASLIAQPIAGAHEGGVKVNILLGSDSSKHLS